MIWIHVPVKNKNFKCTTGIAGICLEGIIIDTGTQDILNCSTWRTPWLFCPLAHTKLWQPSIMFRNKEATMVVQYVR